MLQGDVLVCGTVNSSAVEKTTKDGNTFITFSVLVPIQGKDGSVCETIVHVSSPGDRKRAVKFVAGKSVQAQGRLTVRIKDGIVYYNVRCENEPIFISADTEYRIEGSMDFTGCIGKDGVTIRQDKKQRGFKLFAPSRPTGTLRTTESRRRSFFGLTSSISVQRKMNASPPANT